MVLVPSPLSEMLRGSARGGARCHGALQDSRKESSAVVYATKVFGFFVSWTSASYADRASTGQRLLDSSGNFRPALRPSAFAFAAARLQIAGKMVLFPESLVGVTPTRLRLCGLKIYSDCPG